MPSPYVYERQSEYWTSRAVEDALLDAGFDCLAFPLTGRTEHLLPADFIFAGDTAVNVFGFQYKALYGDPRDGWQIDERQRKALERFSWIYYGLSELKETRHHRLALHALRITTPRKVRSPFTEKADMPTPGSYTRWWAFFQDLLSESAGEQVSNEGDFLRLLTPAATVIRELRELGQAIDVILLNASERRRAIRFSSALPSFGDDRDLLGQRGRG
jgi:hypothetical protein